MEKNSNSWFFNADFEDFLASEATSYTPKSSRQNQELEYFILWLEDEALYSTKKYAHKYLDFISQIKQAEVKISSSIKGIKPWCASTDNKELAIKLNSKITSTEFSLANDFSHEKIEIIKSMDQVEEGLLYKHPFGVSGIGHLTSPKDNKKINKCLEQQGSVIKEPILDRLLDFSTLVNADTTMVYINDVDSYFQYKGTTIGIDFNIYSWFPQYQIHIQKIISYYQSLGIKGSWSIDSFLYQEGSETHLYSLSEVNARKTMGYVAQALKNKYFQDYSYFRFKMLTSKKIVNGISNIELFEQFNESVIQFSPEGNIFSIYGLAANSLIELDQLDEELTISLI